MRWAEALSATGLGDHLAIEGEVKVDAEALRAVAWAPGVEVQEEWVWGGRAARPGSWAV